MPFERCTVDHPACTIQSAKRCLPIFCPPVILENGLVCPHRSRRECRRLFTVTMRRILVTASLCLDKQPSQTQKLRFRRLKHIAKRRLGIAPLARKLRRLRRQQQGQRFLAQQTQRIRCLSSGTSTICVETC